MMQRFHRDLEAGRAAEQSGVHAWVVDDTSVIPRRGNPIKEVLYEFNDLSDRLIDLARELERTDPRMATELCARYTALAERHSRLCLGE